MDHGLLSLGKKKSRKLGRNSHGTVGNKPEFTTFLEDGKDLMVGKQVWGTHNVNAKGNDVKKILLLTLARLQVLEIVIYTSKAIQAILYILHFCKVHFLSQGCEEKGVELLGIVFTKGVTWNRVFQEIRYECVRYKEISGLWTNHKEKTMKDSDSMQNLNTHIKGSSLSHKVLAAGKEIPHSTMEHLANSEGLQ
ncbi:hypothetical protein Lal_00026289 [Lupinus albus]|nr:hypothetical protein Lal_00026289 [Lupinus albus]